MTAEVVIMSRPYLQIMVMNIRRGYIVEEDQYCMKTKMVPALTTT
jgi:hypothetical protein